MSTSAISSLHLTKLRKIAIFNSVTQIMLFYSVFDAAVITYTYFRLMKDHSLVLTSRNLLQNFTSQGAFKTQNPPTDFIFQRFRSPISSPVPRISTVENII